jgi:hypothetical protein
MYLIPVIFCFAAWVGTGIDGMFSFLHQRIILRIALWVLVIFLILVNAFNVFPKVDASDDKRADQFAKNILQQTPANAILFVKGDEAVFSLWYYHYALHERPDLAVIASDLLHFPWYLETLRAAYPSLVFSEPFPWTQTIIEMNPEYPYCYIRDVDNIKIECTYP